MADIRTFLEKIKNAVYGREVRQAIHDGIRCCYDDGKAGSIDLQAREDIAILKDMVEYGVLQSGGDWFCKDFSEVNQAILSEVKTMRINSVKHVSMQLDIPNTVLCSAGRMSIYYGMYYGPRLCAHAEITTMDGYRLHTTCYAPEGGSLAGMVFEEWEWENPPMGRDEEYRTTERHLGKPVYARHFRIDSSCINNDAPDLDFMKVFDVDATARITSVHATYCSELYRSDETLLSVTHLPYRVCGSDIRIQASVGTDSSAEAYRMTVHVFPPEPSDIFSGVNGYDQTVNKYVDVTIKYTK